MPVVNCSTVVASSDTATRGIEIRRGDDVVVQIPFQVASTRLPYDFTGWTMSSKVKSDYGGSLWATGIVTHDDAGGVVRILYQTSETSLLTPGDVGVWDLQGIDPFGLIRTLVGGSATVTPDVT
jgi:hypothetical protein